MGPWSLRWTGKLDRLTGPFDGLAVPLAGDVIALDEIAAAEDHRRRAAVQACLDRMRGDSWP